VNRLVSDQVISQRRSKVATITIDSPHNRNALSSAVLAGLHDALNRALDDEHVRVIVLTGSGNVFCSGADLQAVHPGISGSGPSMPAILEMIAASSKPIVARVNGHARAGGIGLIAAADLAIAIEGASFAFSEVRIGVVPAIIAVPVLRRVHPRAVQQYFLTGERFSAARAEQIGLITASVAEDRLDATVEETIEALLRGGPEALGVCKELINSVPQMPTGRAYERMALLSADRFASAEAIEGIAAFRQHRQPSWVSQTRVDPEEEARHE
jgi:methylglutaconyl-CoA hydratase